MNLADQWWFPGDPLLVKVLCQLERLECENNLPSMGSDR
jgi:hypothetical protein